jgi:glycosyltransferase involved in cell wall biosynthesis
VDPSAEGPQENPPRGSVAGVIRPMRVLAVTNMYPTPDHPTLGTFVEQQVSSLRLRGVSVDVLLADRSLQGPRAYITLATQIGRHLNKGVDLVHVMYGGVMAAVVSTLARDVPLLVSFCGSDLLGQRFSGLRRRVAAQVGVSASYFAARRASAIVVKSRNLYDALPASIRGGKRIEIIPNGVDLEQFFPSNPAESRARLGWPEEQFHVLFPANNGDATKRPWLAKEAVDRARTLGIPASLHELSGVSHSLVREWLNAADVVLLTSDHEGSPNVVKEALACDTAVVSVDVGDVATRVEGVAGCHIVAADSSALAAALALVHRHRGKVAARQKIEPLSREAVAASLCDLYERCIRSSTPARG